ncbi:nucleotidyltransferase domain-containing protein [Trinickia diaoshuihuensis]|uniref:nucleotidyltransferase domain-containing protein n=1 Tax=Trinickia diaoshuihuensis TaxID=2292265 RepID=UPI000E2697DB|nr:nucleotidyltransferase domain-containing protein [Trinickia diaoshuihuensis]
MKNAMLSELFGGVQRFALLRLLYRDPTRSYTTLELSRMAGADRGNVSRWLRKWSTVGLAKRTEQGLHITYQAGDDPLLSSLTEIARKSDEILDDITHTLPDEVEAAVVFGSVARGEESAKSDVDVLVLGNGLSSLKINARLKPVGRKHHREIHATVASRREFEQKLAAGEGFASNIVSRPFILLKGIFDYASS